MEFKFDYEPVRFNGLLSDIREAFPHLEELDGDDASRRSDVLSERLSAIDTNSLFRLAKALKSKELELILYLMKAPVEEMIISKAEIILKLRFRKKLFDLCWILLQGDYDNKGLLNAACVLSECMQTKHPDEYEVSFLFKAGKMPGSLVQKAHSLLIEEKCDIRGFCRRYSILEHSVFAQKLRELFFTGCDTSGFVNNRESILKHMNGNDLDSMATVFSVYLDKLKVIEYFDIVNHMVVNKWGNPEKAVEFWQRLDDEGIAKFSAWQDLKRIEQHFGRESKRYKLWAGYFDKMQRIEADDAAQLLIMEFENFVVLDFKEEEGWSYLYMKDYFKDEYERYEGAKQNGASQWRIITELVAGARDLVIEGNRSDIYRVGYVRVEMLYLKEILKLELEQGASFYFR